MDIIANFVTIGMEIEIVKRQDGFYDVINGPDVVQEKLNAEGVIGYMSNIINNTEHLRHKAEKKAANLSWIESPDRMGGMFTEGEKNRDPERLY